MAAATQYFEQDSLLERSLDRQILWRLLSYVRPHWRMAALGFGLIVLVTLLALVMPVVIGRILDDLRGPGNLFQGLALAYLGCETLRLLVGSIQGYVVAVLGQRVVYGIRMHLFRRFQEMPLALIQRHPVGRLVTRVVFDVESLAEMMSSGILTVILDLFLVAGVAVALLVADLEMGLVTLSILPPLVVWTALFRHYLRRVHREVARSRSAVNASIAENLNGMREVQAFVRERQIFAEFDQTNRELMTQQLASTRLYAFFQPGFSTLSSLGVAIVVYHVGSAVQGGEIPIGLFGQFFFLVRMLVDPLRDLAEKYNVLLTSTASADRIFRLLDTPTDRALATPRGDFGRPAGRIEFEGVSFAYPGATGPVLRDLTFSIEPGQSIALVGHTGVGKSTVVNLLCRFYDVDKGAIRLDGRDLREWHPEDLRRQITIVDQEAFLFAGDIRRNLTLGDPHPHEPVEEAARLIGAHDFIEELPGGYEAAVTHLGSTLSAGQRQLVTFARAILRDAPILVLDEATSSVDLATERRIQDALGRLFEGRTSIVIAHRLSTVERCDRVLVLDKGRLVESGTHEELLGRRGAYHELYWHQLVRDRD